MKKDSKLVKTGYSPFFFSLDLEQLVSVKLPRLPEWPDLPKSAGGWLATAAAAAAVSAALKFRQVDYDDEWKRGLYGFSIIGEEGNAINGSPSIFGPCISGSVR